MQDYGYKSIRIGVLQPVLASQAELPSSPPLRPAIRDFMADLLADCGAEFAFRASHELPMIRYLTNQRIAPSELMVIFAAVSLDEQRCIKRDWADIGIHPYDRQKAALSVDIL
jgi:hypothetical protein